MRWVWVVVIAGAACDPGANGTFPDGEMHVVDADPCPRDPVETPGCVYLGLENVSLDGMWTLTGTISDFGQTPTAYTTTKYMQRIATNRCTLLMSSSPITDGANAQTAFIDDTHASYSESGYYPHSHSYSWSMCVRDTDGSLVYHERTYLSMPMMDRAVEGVLTR